MNPMPPTKVDILVPTYNRLEFTQIVLESLVETTNPGLVGKLIVMDAGSTDGTLEFLKTWSLKNHPLKTELHTISDRHVVASMLKALTISSTPLIAKIDSDTVVPPGWLDACLPVMEANQDLWALGVEARWDDPNPVSADGPRTYIESKFVGGIGLFRRKAWEGAVPRKAPFQGWTEHQSKQSWKKGWIAPLVRTFLLDHLPMPRFKGLNERYVTEGWQRDVWGSYQDSNSTLWEWKYPGWKDEMGAR